MIVESTVNPRTIVLPLIEQCIEARIPILCLNGLRKTTSANFGIPTSCLGVKCDCLEGLKEKISILIKHYTPPQISKNNKDTSVMMEVVKNNDIVETAATPQQQQPCPYLYRTNTKTRVFIPTLAESKTENAFSGQDYIEFSDKPNQETDSKAYMDMVLKKVTSNKNRIKENKH